MKFPGKLQVCFHCDGIGLDGDSGDGWWDQSPCEHCHGSGFEIDADEYADVNEQQNQMAAHADQEET